MAVKKQLDYDAFGMIERRAANTKDWQKLNLGSNDEFPVFVVGQWRKNRAQNYRLDGCNYYGKGVTYSDEFIMKRCFSGEASGGASEPLSFHLPRKNKALWKEVGHIFSANHLRRVEGDIYGVPLSKLAELDVYENNGEEVSRNTHWVDFYEQKQGPRAVEALMYTVDMDEFLDRYNYSMQMWNCNTVSYSEKVVAYYFSS